MTELLDSPEAGPAAIRGGAVRVAGYLGGVLLSVGSAALLFRHLGVTESGRYVLVLSLVTIAVGLTEAGLSALGVLEIAQSDRAEAPALLRNLLGLRLVLSSAGVVVACAYAAIAGYGGRLVLGTAVAGIAVLLQGVQAVLTVALQAELRFAAVTVSELVRQAANVVAIVVLVLAGAGLLPFFSALVVASLCGLAACVLLLRRGQPSRGQPSRGQPSQGQTLRGQTLRPAFDSARWRALLARTLPFALATAIAVVYLRAGLLLLDKLANAHETGLYSVSFRVVEVISQVPALIVGAAFPIFARAARDDAARLRYALQRMFDASLMLGALLAVLLAVGAPAVIEIVGGHDFRAADGVLRWHALAVAGTFAAQPFGFALLASGRTRSVLAQTTAALIVSLGATVPLAQAYGAEGAAAAAAGAEWALAIAGMALLAQGGGPRVSLGTAGKVVVAAAVACLPVLVLPALPAAAVAGLLFCALVWALGAVPEELLQAFRRR